VDAFKALSDLFTALNNNDPDAVRATLDPIEKSHVQMVTERARTGLTLDRLSVADSALEFAEGGLGKQENDLGAADPFEAYTATTTLAQALERAVAVSQQLLNLGSLAR
jgi:flagellar hook-associated protein 3 FlgL